MTRWTAFSCPVKAHNEPAAGFFAPVIASITGAQGFTPQVQGWLSRIDKDAKDARDKRIFSKWLACWTQDEIAESEGMTHGPVTAILSDFPILENQTKSAQTLATYAEPDWTPPIYNPQAQGVDYIGPPGCTPVNPLLHRRKTPQNSPVARAIW